MDLNEYQQKSRKTALYPEIGNNLGYPTLGLCDEAGEVAGKVKKMFRDDHGILSYERREAIILELGDVLWYVAQLATELNVSLDEVAERNITKLYSRLERDQIHGDGDNR